MARDRRLDVACFGLEEDLRRSPTIDILRAATRAPAQVLRVIGLRLAGARVRARNRLAALVGERLSLAPGMPLPLPEAAPEPLDEDILFLVGEGVEPLPGARTLMAQTLKNAAPVQAVFGAALAYPNGGGQAVPILPPSFSQEGFLGLAPLAPFIAIRRAALEAVGEPATDLPGSTELDLLLRVAHRFGDEAIERLKPALCRWRAIDRSAADGEAVCAARLEAARRHAARRGWSCRVALDEAGGVLLHRALPTPPPRVSVIIPTRDRLDLLGVAIEGLREKTDYPDLEILIVDNGSTQAETLAYLSALEASGTARVLRDDGAFNYSRLNNRAAREATGCVLVLLNNDISMIEPGWLAPMVSEALRPEVGAVGARLLYPSTLVQHGGVVLGLSEPARHAHQFYPAQHRGYLHRLATLQRFGAVTAACLVVEKRKFDEVGGLDEALFAVAMNDVDLCLKLDAAGFRNLYQPLATLYHHESASRAHDRTASQLARWEGEIAAFRRKWPQWLADDPWYHPALGQQMANFALPQEFPRAGDGA